MDYPTAQENYNAAGKTYWEANFLFIRSQGGATFGFSDRRRTLNVAVASVVDGSEIIRTYEGGKHIISLPEITRGEGLTTNQHAIVLSRLSAEVRNMIFGHNLTRAWFEWHKAQLDARSGKPIALPVCELLGMVDSIPDETTAAGREQPAVKTVTLVVIPHHSEFEYRNPAMRSDAEARKRGGDRIFNYAGAMANRQVGWGKTLARFRDGHDSHDGHKPKDDGYKPPIWGHG